MAARAFQPGQFYRLQNYETLAPRSRRHDAGDGRPGADRRLGRPRARPAIDDRARNGRLVRSVRAAEAGRAGGADGADRHADRDPAGETVLLVGGGLGNAVLFSIGAALRARGLARALFRRLQEDRSTATRSTRSKRAADAVVWCCDEAPGFAPGRPQDLAFVGNIVQAMVAYGDGDARAGRRSRSATVDRIIAIGSDGMMAAVAEARHGVLAPLSSARITARSASINSPMQCMMKEICAQCLQRAPRPGDRQGDGRVLVLQPGPGASTASISGTARAPAAERRAGEADKAVDRPLPAASRPASGGGRGGIGRRWPRFMREWRRAQIRAMLPLSRCGRGSRDRHCASASNSLGSCAQNNSILAPRACFNSRSRR